MTYVDAALEQQVFTFPNDSGNLTYIMTTRRITSGDELKYRKELGGLALDLRLMRAR